VHRHQSIREVHTARLDGFFVFKPPPDPLHCAHTGAAINVKCQNIFSFRGHSLESEAQLRRLLVVLLQFKLLPHLLKQPLSLLSGEIILCRDPFGLLLLLLLSGLQTLQDLVPE